MPQPATEIEPMVNRYFGEGWEPEGFQPTDFPHLQKCCYCEEEFRNGQKGYRLNTPREGNFDFIHRECNFRMVVGSVGHLKGKCSCYGGDEEDPPGMSKREAAIACWDYARS